jgi:hypothetical protein
VTERERAAAGTTEAPTGDATTARRTPAGTLRLNPETREWEPATPTPGRLPAALRRRRAMGYGAFPGGTGRLSVTLPLVVLAQLEKLAEREGQSMSAIAATAIIREVQAALWFADQEIEGDAVEVRAARLTIVPVGPFRSGLRRPGAACGRGAHGCARMNASAGSAGGGPVFVRWKAHRLRGARHGGPAPTMLSAVLVEGRRGGGGPRQRVVRYLGSIRDADVEGERAAPARGRFWASADRHLEGLGLPADQRRAVEAALRAVVPRPPGP